MNVNANKTDDLNQTLSISVAAGDYADSLKKKLSDYRRKAEFKGFRKGMAPAQMIEKFYGPQALMDCVNDCIADALNDYIKKENLSIVGEPLPSADQPEQEWKKGNDFSFNFDIALTPKVSMEVGKEDELPLYTITVTAAAKKDMKKQMLSQCGTLKDVEKAGEDDFLTVDFIQGDKTASDVYVALRAVSEACKADFIGLKKDDKKTIDVVKAFENETDRASMLKLKKEELASMQPEWEMTVKTVKSYVDGEPNQENFDRLFGKDKVKSEEEMDAKIEERLKAEYKGEADSRLQKDMKAYFVKKAALSVPEDFMKRWITATNEKLTAEQIDKEFPAFIEDYKWQLVKSFLMEKFSVKIEESDLKTSAVQFAAYQYAMYGMYDVPQESLDSFAESLLKSEQDRQRLVDLVSGNKLTEALRDVVTLKAKKISVEKFRELE